MHVVERELMDFVNDNLPFDSHYSCSNMFNLLNLASSQQVGDLLQMALEGRWLVLLLELNRKLGVV